MIFFSNMKISQISLKKILLLFIIIDSCNVFAYEKSKHINKQHFADPPKEYRQHAWLTYDLSHATEENLTSQIRRWAEQDLTGGFYLGLAGGNTTGLSDEYLKGANCEPSNEGLIFLSSKYFDLYAKAIDAGLKYGNPPLVFYDEVGYPSGMAGGFLYSKYPQHAAKSLEKIEQDFTFLHPEVMQTGCIIKDKHLILDNEINREQYSVLVIPGSRVLSIKTVRKIQAFYEAGGTVIATRILADKSAEQGKDQEVKQIIQQVFDLPDDGPLTAEFHRRLDEFMVYFINRNEAGGRAYFLPDYTPEMIQAIMQETVPVWDVAIQEPMWPVKLGRS